MIVVRLQKQRQIFLGRGSFISVRFGLFMFA